MVFAREEKLMEIGDGVYIRETREEKILRTTGLNDYISSLFSTSAGETSRSSTV